VTRTGEGHEHWADAVGAYLLDAMPAGERESFEAHVAVCKLCREEVEALRVAADALPVAVAQMEPPPELKDRIMGIVNAEARLLEAAGERADVPEPARSERERPAPWWRRALMLRPALAAAAAAVLLLAGGVAGMLVAGGDGSETVVAQVDQQVAPGARVTLEIDGDDADLVASRLPEPPAGRVYQVWLQRGDQAPEPTDTLFLPRTDGSARAALPEGAADADAILVTHEPRGGSRAPTQAPFVSVRPV
jgi:anti-sigma-K factor RskA